MHQKYKIFITDFCVYVKENRNSSTSTEDAVSKAVELIESQKIGEDMTMEVDNIDTWFKAVTKRVKLVKAGGGFVLNNEHQLLMIYRRGFWDLPKGKVEAGESIEETSVREVEEECGVRDLRITSKGYQTYHTYFEKGTPVLKESTWFSMVTDDDRPLIPQTEEDIEQAVWVDLPVKASMLHKAYSSIRDVVDYFSESSATLPSESTLGG